MTAPKLLIISGTLRVHQIEIEIVHAAPRKLLLEKRPDVLLLLEIRVRQLVREKVFIPLMAAGQRRADRRLRFSVDIAMRRIKIVEPVLEEQIGHLNKLLQIHLIALHRKTHTAKAKVFFHFRK